MSSPKRVLMIGWEYPPHHSGGLGVACQGMAHALADRQHYVCFALPKKMPISDTKVTLLYPNKKSGKVGGKEISILRELYNPYIEPSRYHSFREQSKDILDPMFVPGTLKECVELYGVELSRELLENPIDVDIIHAHDWLCFPAAVAVKKLLQKPFIAHIHATEFDRSGGQGANPYVYQQEKLGMEESAHIITVSELVKRTVINKYGIPPEKITVIHNGNTDLASKNESIFDNLITFKEKGYSIVLYAGRITLQKGVEYFVHAAKKALEVNPKIIFIIAGTGDMERYIIELVNNLGISSNFMFTGYYTLDDMASLLKHASLFVMPSVSEPFGIVPLEAITKDVPVIISKQSGVSEILHHALKVDFWDTDKIANQILAVIHHPPLHKVLREEGRRQVQDITWDKAASKIHHVYNSVL
ncbi:MAG: hypothetical protein RI935_141 [Candidatus Parcubacteria bacterium]|jgi:glycosyltransferase involved in cell wall biosynthesis